MRKKKYTAANTAKRNSTDVLYYKQEEEKILPALLYYRAAVFLYLPVTVFYRRNTCNFRKYPGKITGITDSHLTGNLRH